MHSSFRAFSVANMYRAEDGSDLRAQYFRELLLDWKPRCIPAADCKTGANFWGFWAENLGDASRFTSLCMKSQFTGQFERSAQVTVQR